MSSEPEEPVADDRKWNRRVTLEPAMFFFAFGVATNAIAMQVMVLDRACRVNLAHSDEVCDALSALNASEEFWASQPSNLTYESVDTDVQHLVADVYQWKFVVDHAFPIFLCLVMGAWSDKHGRKPLFLVSQMGYVLANLSLVLAVFQPAWSVETLVLMYGLFHGSGGASVVFFLACWAFIVDITTAETRTMRMGTVNVSASLAFPLASAASGPLLKAVGFQGVFSITSACHLFCFLYLMLAIPETRVSKGEGRLKDLFDVTQVYHAFKAVLKPRKVPGQRIQIVILVGLSLFTLFHYGEMSVYLIFVRHCFQWGSTLYGVYSMYKFIIMIMGMGFALGVLSHVLKVPDATIGVLGSITQILGSLSSAFSPQIGAWVLFLGPFIDFLSGVLPISNKALLAKVVEPDELGQVTSVICVMEALMPIVSNPLYLMVYEVTLDSALPGAPFFLSTVAGLVCLLAFGYLRKLEKKQTGHLDPIVLMHYSEVVVD